MSNKTLHTRLITIILLLLLSIFQTVFAEGEDGAEGVVSEEAAYYELAPPFVVNLRESGKRIRFLQARIQVLAYGTKAIDQVKIHDAPIRDALITLLASKTRTDINTTKKKKELQKEALEKVQDILRQETGRKYVEGLYFTSFVIQ
ncbi:MAG: flagellar basal body-associated FliL family protein [Gammaproteobacteria bacterium]|nr:flagellar basal body-associated FliL family protein [Gammaproteobacteria bacterium]